MLTTRPRGTEDIIAPEADVWQAVEELARTLSHRYGYEEIRTPLFEHTELYARSVGETSDIVSKEMYTFTDRGGRSLTLRPEGTAGVVRAFLENRLYARPLPVKLYYLGPMFRFARPQAGRLRQFHQFGVELLGAGEAAADAEVISLAMEFYRHLGLEELTLRLNSVGCPACRPAYREVLLAYLEPRQHSLCADCLARYARNPLRVFDCKEEGCRQMLAEAPLVTAYLCPECSAHFAAVRDALRLLAIPYEDDPYLVRGLDYYTKTAFEVIVPGIGAQSAIGGGGRYDGLVEAFGGPHTPAVGFATGLERVLLALGVRGKTLAPPAGRKVFVAAADAAGAAAGVELLARLRRAGFTADRDYLGRSLKAQMKHADRWGATITVIVGEAELGRGTVTVRHMQSGEQETVPFGQVVEALKEHLAR